MTQLWHDLVVRQASERPHAAAMSDTTGKSWTWAQLDSAVQSAAAMLRDHGVQRGDRVLLLAENCCAAVAWR